MPTWLTQLKEFRELMLYGKRKEYKALQTEMLGRYPTAEQRYEFQQVLPEIWAALEEGNPALGAPGTQWQALPLLPSAATDVGASHGVIVCYATDGYVYSLNSAGSGWTEVIGTAVKFGCVDVSPLTSHPIVAGNDPSPLQESQPIEYQGNGKWSIPGGTKAPYTVYDISGRDLDGIIWAIAPVGPAPATDPNRVAVWNFSDAEGWVCRQDVFCPSRVAGNTSTSRPCFVVPGWGYGIFQWNADTPGHPTNLAIPHAALDVGCNEHGQLWAINNDDTYFYNSVGNWTKFTGVMGQAITVPETGLPIILNGGSAYQRI